MKWIRVLVKFKRLEAEVFKKLIQAYEKGVKVSNIDHGQEQLFIVQILYFPIQNWSH